MNISYRSLLLAGAHALLLLSIGAKMRYDRAELPHLWIQTVPFDPNLPIRGRYLSLTLECDNPTHGQNYFANLEAQHDHAVCVPSETNHGDYVSRAQADYGLLSPPVAFFISDTADDPSRHLGPGQELWVDVTLVPDGYPRPIRLGIKHNGIITPLN